MFRSFSVSFISGNVYANRIDFKTDDESDAVAIAVCHALSGGKSNKKIPKTGRGRTLKQVFS